MGRYFFEDEGNFDATKRLEDVASELNKLHLQDELGDETAYLSAFQSADIQKPQGDLGIDGEKDSNAVSEDTWIPVDEKTDETGEKKENPLEPKKQGGSSGGPPFWGDKLKNPKVLIGLAALLGVLLFMFAFALAGGKRQPQIPPSEETAAIYALVLALTDKGELLIYDIEKKEKYTVSTGEDTAYTKPLGGISDVSLGDIFEIVVNTENQAKEIAHSSTAWKKVNTTGNVIDAVAKTITMPSQKKNVQGEVYRFDDSFTVFYSGKTILPGDLADCDVLTLVGLDKQIYSATVSKYHGSLVLLKGEAIENGKIQIDGGEEKPLTMGEKFPLAEGSHTVVVSGSNIETRTNTVRIVPDEDTILDLSLAQEKTGVLIVKCSVADAKLYIDGSAKELGEPVVLTYGEHEVVVLKNGYQTWEEKVAIQEAAVVKEVTLEKEIEYGNLLITTIPDGATIFIDQEEIGVGPIEKKLPYHTYTITVKAPGYVLYQGSVIVDKPTVEESIELREELSY